MGNGMSLTGLVIPLKGGIVLDMKRMNRILEVNAMARYAVMEGGASQGVLKAYLQEHYPQLRHSIPDAPPATTIAANVALHGQGRLTQQYGFNSEMVTGLEVVLPTGEICLIGSPSLGPYWFSRGPTMPDLSALFLGWLGTTGIITRIGLRLYTEQEDRDVELFVTDRVDLIPDMLYSLRTGNAGRRQCLVPAQTASVSGQLQHSPCISRAIRKRKSPSEADDLGQPFSGLYGF
jgi:glycolate oxidase